MTENNNFISNMQELFANSSILTQSDGRNLTQLRQKSFATFLELGMPNPKVEEWKYNNLAFLNEKKFSIAEPTKISQEFIETLCFEGLESTVLVFVNGVYSPDNSKIIHENSFEFLPLSKMLGFDEDVEFFNDLAKIKSNAFSLLNTALFRDGVCIKIKDNCTINAPIHIINIFSAEKDNVVVSSRNLIVLGRNSQAKVLETFETIGNHYVLNIGVNEFVLKQDAHLERYIIENENEFTYTVNHSQAIQGNNSIFNSTSVYLDGAYVRNNLYSELRGTHTETHYYGLYLADKKNFVDNHTFVDHATPDCQSNEVYKGIIGDEANAVFNGRILVRPNAQRTNAYQSNKNLLLSDTATINTKPELEIYADDVKCSHGATSGSLDEDSLFYLMARGIGRDKAEAMLQLAFAQDIIDKIQIEEVKEYLHEIICERLNIHL